MNLGDMMVYTLTGAIAASLLAYVWHEFLSPEAKYRRRRQRSHGRIVTRAHRPMVKFSVRTK